MNSSLKKLMILGVATELAIFLIAYIMQPSIEETFRYAARYSGRLSMFVFLYTFYLFAMSYPQPISNNYKLRNFIIVFAILHMIHFVFLATNVFLNGIPLQPIKLAGGFLAYVMIVVAPFKLHQMRFKFQLVYFYYVTLVMLLTYVARVKGDFEGAEPFWLHFFMLAILILCALLFVAWLLKPKKSKS